MAISQDGLHGRVVGRKDLRLVVYTISFDYDRNTRSWKVSGLIRIRYKINSRVKLYVKALQPRLADYGIMTDVREPCFITLQSSAYGEEFFPDLSSEGVANQLMGEIYGMTYLMMSMARLAQLSYRLAGRAGTHEYAAVMPSKLAALTMCNANQRMS